MFRARITLITVLATGCLTLSCGPKGVNDQALATEIQAKLYANDATRAANVKVAVANGVVTLSGDVPSSDVELQAMKIANGATGVQSVTDQMKVNSAAVPATALADTSARAPIPPPAADGAPAKPAPAPVAA